MRFWHSSHTAICGKYTSLTAFYQAGYEILAFIPYCKCGKYTSLTVLNQAGYEILACIPYCHMWEIY